MDFNISEWSAARNGPQARLYESVARRRAHRASEDAELSRALAETGFALGPSPPLPPLVAPAPAGAGGTDANVIANGASARGAPAEGAPAATAAHAASETSSVRSADSTPAAGAPAPTHAPASLLPVRPHEDPDLVGPAAATAARERRLYLQGCAREERARRERDALRREDASWNFMLAQMADWAARERSWEEFRRSVRKKKGWRRFFR